MKKCRSQLALVFVAFTLEAAIAQDEQQPKATPTPGRCKEAHSDVWESEPAKKGSSFRTRPVGDRLIGRQAGSSTGNSLFFSVGIEQWTQNQRETFRRQVWHFSCKGGNSEQPKTPVECTVRRTVIDTAMMGGLPIVAEHYHSLDDETLRIGRFDWEKGVAELSIVHTNGRTAEVTILFAARDGAYFLKEFSAAMLIRELPSGTVSVIEFRIPKYTYHVNVPIEIPGVSDAGLQPWDELFGTLSKADQVAWYALFAEKETGFSKLDTDALLKVVLAAMKKRFPSLNIDEKNLNDVKLTEAQKSVFLQLSTEHLREASISVVRSSPRLSDEAKIRIIQYLSEHFALE